MKLKIYSKKTAEKCDKDQLFLRLFKDDTNEDDILLVVVDSNGEGIKQGCILYIDNDLKGIINVSNVSDKVPLKLDIFNRVLTATSSDIQMDRHSKIMSGSMLRLAPLMGKE